MIYFEGLSKSGSENKQYLENLNRNRFLFRIWFQRTLRILAEVAPLSSVKVFNGGF